MDGPLSSDNVGSSSWPSFAPFEVSLYLSDYAESLDARRSQAMPTHGDSRTVYNARHVVNLDTRVAPWIKGRAH